jgi:hypothetical protein
LKPASPRLKAGANDTLRHLLEQQRRPLGAAQRHAAQVLQPGVRPMWRISTSRPLRSRKPPLLLPAKSRSAASSASNSTPAAPCGPVWLDPKLAQLPADRITCATPGIDSSRGRST